MYTLEKVKRQIVREVNKALGTSTGLAQGKIVRASDLVSPPNHEFGDISLPCFEIGKKANKRPVEIVEWLVGNIAAEGMITGLQAAGPYVNFTINKVKLACGVLKEINDIKNKYGENKTGKKERVMIEYSNANTHKEYHVGHLRNICYGDAVYKILAANGYDAIPVSYINDFGIHVAKTLWAYEQFYRDKKLPANKGYFLGQVYARAVKEMEKEPLAKEKVVFMMKKIEARVGAEFKLWEKTREWSINQLTQVYKQLGVKFSHIFYESEFIKAGMKKAAELYGRGFLIKSQGAVIADLSDDNLGVLLFLRSDGTALYPVADVPLAIEKIKKYRLTKSIYVVDIRQSLYFKQLFKTLEKLGVRQELTHLAYEFVKLPAGMMSSRTGNVITYEDLREQVLARAKSETMKRHPEWSEQKINKVVGALANGALKFEMIKVSAKAIITFDINQALRFDGYTAAYLQYTYARINSILRKDDANLQINVLPSAAPNANGAHANTDANSQIANDANKTESRSVNYSNLVEVKEHGLVLQLAKYPDTVKKAGADYDPSEVAKYLFTLAQAFNDYYHQIPVLKAEKEIREARLDLIMAVSQVIKNGLSLLGIEVVREM